MWKRILGVTSCAVFMSALLLPVEAQQRGQRGQRGGRRPNLDDQIEALTTQLELTEEQAKSVRAVIEKQGQQRRELFRNSGGDREAMRAAMGDLQEATDSLLAEILTEDQMVKYKEIQSRRRRRGPPF